MADRPTFATAGRAAHSAAGRRSGNDPTDPVTPSCRVGGAVAAAAERRGRVGPGPAAALPEGADCGPDVLGVDESPGHPGIEFSAPPVIGSSQPTAIDTLRRRSAGRRFRRDTWRHRPAARSASATGSSPAWRIGAGGLIIAFVALIAIFLLIQAVPAIKDDKANFLLSRHWNISGSSSTSACSPLLWTTVVVSLIAMIIAVPISIGIALFITFYAPKSMARPVAYVIDLLAAIPSIVYGIWGIAILAPHLTGVQRALYHLGIGIFSDKHVLTGSIFDGSIVLAVMILPIITAISRDVFERTPRYNIEAAWALGATRWEMIRLAVLPFGRPGVISASMLGLGRALGETIAISLILSAPATGRTVQLVDLRRRRDVRVEDRQQRGRVR